MKVTSMRTQAKAAPPTVSAAAEDEQDRQWAGDLYETGDETDPAAAFARFTAADGAEAWLDKASDGTVTGWVRERDGAVYRYTDPDAWAQDVDHSGMLEATGETGETGEGGEVDAPPVDGEDADMPAPAGAGAGDDVDGEGEDLDDGSDADEDEDGEGDLAAEIDAAFDGDEADPDPDDDDDEDEDEDEDAFPFANVQKKSWPAPGGGRMFARTLRG